jgi:hypothetical protein
MRQDKARGERNESLDELLQGYPELEGPLYRFAEELVRTRKEVQQVDDVEDRLVPAGRALMRATMEGIVQTHGDAAVAQALAGAATTCHRKKSW